MIYSYCKACKAKEGACLLPDSHRAQNRVVWYVDFLLGGKHGKRIRKQFKPGVTKKDVEKYEHLTIADYERGTFIPQDKSKTSIADILQKYLNEHAMERNRNLFAAKHYVKVFTELLGQVPIGSLTRQYLEDARSKYKEETERSNSSVNRAFNILKAALTYAVERDYIKQNPAQYLKHLPITETVPRFLSTEEIARLWAYIKDWRLNDYATALLHTGIRPINLKALEWGQVDRQQRIVHITTYKGRRPHTYSVPYDEAVERVFERRHKETRGQGKVLDTSSIRKLAEAAITASGINVGRPENERFTIYGLKHCYASHLLMSGATIFDVAKLLGHTDTTMIVRHYGHLTQEHLRGVQAKINLTPQQTKLEVI